MFRLLLQIRNRNLMRAPCSFHRLSIHCFWSSPALRRSQNDHRPVGKVCPFGLSGIVLDSMNFLDNVVQSRSHRLVHLLRFMAFEEIRLPSISREQFCERGIGHAA